MTSNPGDTINKFRKRLGLSRSELAKKLHTTRVTVYRWETGKVVVPPVVLRLFSLWMHAKDRAERARKPATKRPNAKKGGKGNA